MDRRGNDYLTTRRRADCAPGAARAHTGPPLLLIRANQPRLFDDVILDRRETLLAIRAGPEIDIAVERVKPEVIMMRPVAGRRHRAEVAGFTRVVHALLECFAAALGNAGRAPRNPVDYPVREAARQRCIGIVAD